MVYINNSPHLARKCICPRTSALWEANSFPRAYLKETLWALRNWYVRGQISEHIFAPNGGYCVLKLSFKHFLQHARFWKLGNITQIYKFGIKEHDRCHLCAEKQTITHLFVTCPNVQLFWTVYWLVVQKKQYCNHALWSTNTLRHHRHRASVSRFKRLYNNCKILYLHRFKKWGRLFLRRFLGYP